MSRQRRSLPRILVSAMLAAILSCQIVGPARGDEFDGPKAAAARALFDEGKQLMDAGRYAEAAAKFKESNALDPGMGVKWRWALCLEKTLRVASAWALFTQIADEAAAAKMPDREKLARERADNLKLRLPRMVVVVPREVADVAGLQIKSDGELLRPGLYGTSIPVDPGEHKISVAAPGRRKWETTAQASESATITISIPVLQEEPTVGPITTGSATASAGPEAAGAGAPGWGGQKIGGAVAVGAGAVGLILGGVLGGLAIGKNSDAAKFCRPDDPTLCQPQGVALGQDAKTMGTVSTIGFIASGIVAAGGVVLFLTAPSASAAPKAGGELRLRAAGPTLLLEGSW